MPPPPVRNCRAGNTPCSRTFVSQIDVGDPQSVRHWCEKLRVREDELRRAVEQVGPDTEKVREHLFGGFNPSGPTS